MHFDLIIFYYEKITDYKVPGTEAGSALSFNFQGQKKHANNLLGDQTWLARLMYGIMVPQFKSSFIINLNRKRKHHDLTTKERYM